VCRKLIRVNRKQKGGVRMKINASVKITIRCSVCGGDLVVNQTKDYHSSGADDVLEIDPCETCIDDALERVEGPAGGVICDECGWHHRPSQGVKASPLHGVVGGPMGACDK